MGSTTDGKCDRCFEPVGTGGCTNQACLGYPYHPRVLPWNWTTPKDKPCPICEEDGKVIESRTDYELGTTHEVLRCRYCDHNFEDRYGKLDSR